MKSSLSIFRPAALLLLPLLAACSPSADAPAQEAAAEKRVLAAHDSLMMRMDQLYTKRQELQKAALPDTAAAGRQKRALLAAEAAMMDWMHQYRRPADTVGHLRKMVYYTVQQHRIDSVAQLMNTSLDSAEALLQRHTAPSASSSTPPTP
ncbi:hypothetical protein PK28_11105 [Hymenobacter sp. DG25B]|uniref:hypothetical protein n=1 Tax=Hymenobacter sp. DG25B TaxID=1385664 RepID=UPI00054100C6|nr:hypothetical protein [Hymenobacter sp. DG25B]AIZ64108.1 hypothetical protein PK28_11105 [Hymenobacter sp. DG25B]